MRKVLIAILSGAALLTAAGVASAASTATSTFNVTATVLKNCLVTSPDLAFGNYTPGSGTALTGNTTISVRCTKTTPYTVSLNVGAAANVTAGSAYTQRLLVNGANTLQYNLFSNAGMTTIFGDGTGTTGTIAGTGNGVAAASAQSVTVYGQLPDSATNQNSPPGAYTDQITVTVTY
jgi:spore coat protein U domain-containing protein, fimbrial subunit CupE1/2/3/6